MARAWIHENAPTWDAPKQSIVGGAPQGIFDLAHYLEPGEGNVIPGEWWRVEENGAVVGFGWMDNVWGDAEILLAVDPESRGGGIGTFIMDRLESEAAGRGLNYMYNVVRETHPQKEALTRWLQQRGFESGRDDRLMRRVRQAT